MTTYIIIAAVAYLLGSIPFGYILVRVFLKQDIRATGSGNIGATNVGRTGHKGLAIATLLLDGAKGWVAVWAATLLLEWRPLPAGQVVLHTTERGTYPITESYMIGVALAALFAILGHLFPVWLKFKGGKGVATGAGAYLALAPRAVLVVLAVFVVVVAIFRYVSLGSMVATAAFPVAVWYMTEMRHFPAALVAVAASAVFIIGKHHENIRRLLRGTENRLGTKPKVPPPEQMEKQA